VDTHGCPIDSDGDGVCDGLDRCANTPPGTQVDEHGCPVFEATAREAELIERGRIRLSNLNFDTGKAGVSPADYAVLDTVGRVLAKWPGLMVEVAGHTDTRGSAASNRDLSQRRAVSVRAYLLAHFPQLKPGQLTAKGYGGTKPIVPNTSTANMSRNRRVEFEVLNPQVLQHRP
jgi:OOP family OmpA-OmpF porin